MAFGKKKKEKESKAPETVADDFLAQEAAEEQETAFEYTLDIPEDEIWTYQIEGLQEPHINKPFEKAGIKKAVVIIALLIAISCAIFLSVRAVHSDMYSYNQLEDGTYELVKFSNPGGITEVTVDYVVDLETGEKDTSKPITAVSEYAFNCDETLNTITLGKDVKTIDGKSIYSCWYVQNVFVDDKNPYLCDIDGVLYNKDVTTVIHYPNDHDKQLRLEAGYATRDENGVIQSSLVDDEGLQMEELWGTTNKYNEAYYQRYNRDTRTYVIPSTVKTIGELAFAYSNIVDLYIPEGVTKMDNMAIFKNTVLTNIYSYKTRKPITDTTYKAIDQMSQIYASLPEGLEYIGNDCMYYLRGLNYMYIPSSVTHIGHHALWDAVYKEDKELKGVKEIEMGIDEQGFDSKVDAGQQWKPQYDYMLFKKSVDLKFSAQRQSQLSYNVHRQYYWAVQWMLNHYDDAGKAAAGYLVKDMDGDGTPELVLREYYADTKKTKDKILTFKYGYLDNYSGAVSYKAEDLVKVDDNSMLDSILEK